MLQLSLYYFATFRTHLIIAFRSIQYHQKNNVGAFSVPVTFGTKKTSSTRIDSTVEFVEATKTNGTDSKADAIGRSFMNDKIICSFDGHDDPKAEMGLLDASLRNTTRLVHATSVLRESIDASAQVSSEEALKLLPSEHLRKLRLNTLTKLRDAKKKPVSLHSTLASVAMGMFIIAQLPQFSPGYDGILQSPCILHHPAK